MSETNRSAFGDPGGAVQGSERRPVSITINGQSRRFMAEPRTTLLDALREELALTGTKKSCDRGNAEHAPCISADDAFSPA